MLSERRTRRAGRLIRVAGINKAHVALALLLVLGAVLYQHQAFQYFMHDDEGGYAYAAWRISLGEVPYGDFLSPQMPAFLYWGGLLVRLFGRSFVALRVASMLTVLAAAALLYAANCELFGPAVALLSTALFLVDPDAFHNARFFRPEGLMLVFQMAGLYAFIRGERRGRLAWVALAGALFGLSALSKLFGFLPLAGCFIYLLYAWWRERRSLAQTLREGLALGLPALAVVGVTALAFTLVTHRFIAAVLEHHTMQGAGMPLLERARKAALLYRDYVLGQPIVLALAAVGGWLLLRRKQALASLLVWSVPTAAIFLGVSRELQLRHLAYLGPVVVTFAAAAVVQVYELRQRLGASRRAWWAAGMVLTVALVLAGVRPWLARNATEAALAEEDSPHLATLIQQLVPGDQVAMVDYPGLNFLAGRRSTYWAAGISGGAAQSGQVRGAMLIDEIEKQNVELVVINTWGGTHQMAGMVDYPEFLSYIQSHFSLIEQYKCSYEAKVFEVYARGSAVPPDWEASPATAGDGAAIELWLRAAPATAWEQLWAVVQWQDGTGTWHDVEGWQGPPQVPGDGEAGATWAVSPTDLAEGPFRWVVLRGRGGEMLAASDPFYLPADAGGIARIEVALSP